MKKQYIARHDKAVRMLIKSLIKGKQGGNYIVADVGQMEQLKELGVHSKRIPSFVLPDSHMQANQGSEDHKAALTACRDPDRDKMRPDVMVVELSETERRQYLPHTADTGHTLPDLPSTLPNGKARKIYIVEGGYCSDTWYLEKVQQKELQHSALESTLRSYGYDVTILTYILGFYGSTYTSNLKTLKTLGIEHAAANKLSRKTHEHSVTCAHNLNKTRRVLESSRQRTNHTRKRADPR